METKPDCNDDQTWDEFPEAGANVGTSVRTGKDNRKPKNEKRKDGGGLFREQRQEKQEHR